MALIETHFFSTSLCFGTDLNVYVPTPFVDELNVDGGADYFHDGCKFQVLYLLHGGYGDYTDWLRLTGIERYARDHKLVVVMPSASNSMYLDMAYGSDYLKYIAYELPKFCEKFFPISTKREDTFIGGLSMGGYGAMRVALERPEKFSHVITLSGAVDLMGTLPAVGDSGIGGPLNIYTGEKRGPLSLKALFGTEDMDEIAKSDANLFVLAAKRKAEGCELPKVFQSVGTEDFIYPSNQTARKEFEKLGFDLTYEEGPGIHCWEYWDEHIQHALAWLPLADGAVD